MKKILIIIAMLFSQVAFAGNWGITEVSGNNNPSSEATTFSISSNGFISRDYFWMQNPKDYISWVESGEKAPYKGWAFNGVSDTSVYTVTASNLTVGDKYVIYQTGGTMEPVQDGLGNLVNGNTNGVFIIQDLTNPSETIKPIKFQSGTVFGVSDDANNITFTAKNKNEVLRLAAPEIDKDKSLLALALLAGILTLFAERKKEYTV